MRIHNRVPTGGLPLAAILATLVAGLALPAAPAANLVASRGQCPGQQNPKASERRQEDAMRCLINHTRGRAGSGRLSSHRALERGAGRKVDDVFRCGFSHTACGREVSTWPRHYGYTQGTRSWALGENLAWGRGKRGTPRRVLKAWLDSPPHRATLLRGSFEHFGLGLRRGRFQGRDHVSVWVLELGCRGC